MDTSIYGEYEPYLQEILETFSQRIMAENKAQKAKTGYKLYEHFNARIKAEDSMRESAGEKVCQKPNNQRSKLFVTALVYGLSAVLWMTFIDWWSLSETTRIVGLSLKRTISYMPSPMAIALIT